MAASIVLICFNVVIIITGCFLYFSISAAKLRINFLFSKYSPVFSSLLVEGMKKTMWVNPKEEVNPQR